MLYQITLFYACFGIEICDNVVINSAPIGKWMIGKKLKYIKKWVKLNNGKIIKVK